LFEQRALTGTSYYWSAAIATTGPSSAGAGLRLFKNSCVCVNLYCHTFYPNFKAGLPRLGHPRQLASVVNRQHDCYARPMSARLRIEEVSKAKLAKAPIMIPAKVAIQSRTGAQDNPKATGTPTSPTHRSAKPANKT
jgi:hypothetical protein